MMAPPNFVIVEKLLPYIPKEYLDKLKDVAWQDETFTTFSLCDSLMREYEITEEGSIYVRGEDGGIEKLSYTGEIDFNTLISLSDKDCELDFKALFFKGELKSLTLENLKETEQAPRVEAQEKLMKLITKKEEAKKKWWYKTYLIYTKVVVFVFTCVRWFLGLFIKLCWMIQNKIT